MMASRQLDIMNACQNVKSLYPDEIGRYTMLNETTDSRYEVEFFNKEDYLLLRVEVLYDNGGLVGSLLTTNIPQGKTTKIVNKFMDSLNFI
jgi:hypothetical protein